MSISDPEIRPYESEPTDPKDPVDPTNCPTCRSGIQPTDPTFEDAIDGAY